MTYEDQTKEELIDEIKRLKTLYEEYRNQSFHDKRHQRNELRLDALLRLSHMEDKSYNEILDFALEEAITLTKSKIGYIFFYDEDTRVFKLYAWSKSVMQECNIMEPPTIFELDKTGLWGEAVRQRRPIITNQYDKPNELKKGYPEGHVKIKRHLNLPIFRKNKIVAVIGVGNKEDDYTDSDVEQLQLFMDGLWNILEKKQIEQALKKSEEMFRTIVNFTHDWEYWESEDKKIIYCSPSCERITGYHPYEVIQDFNIINQMVHPDDRDSYFNHINTIHKNEETESELQFRIITKNGQERWIGHVCRPVFDTDGQFIGRRVSNRDITERKNKELEMIKTQEQINILNKNILKMLKIMSHDIRSPLIALSATLKLLLRGTYGKLEESVYHTINDLYLRVNQIIGFAEDCLAKAQAVDCELHFDKKEIDLRNEVIEPVLTELLPEIEQKGIFIDNRLGAIPTGTIKVNASKMWLKVVYRNLFSNAIKYGGPGCTIAFGYEDHGSYYRFNVYNTGNTIPEEKRDILFTKFGRISQGEGNHHEGVGMGLFMTREIITEHGGDIWYEPRPNGNDFIFTLPK